jgi:hypothetical protein
MMKALEVKGSTISDGSLNVQNSHGGIRKEDENLYNSSEDRVHVISGEHFQDEYEDLLSDEVQGGL